MGEKSKTSGEIGEKIADRLLKKIGWDKKLYNISVLCNNSNHINKERKPRKTHGEDMIFIYHSPFHDELTEVVHISVKNSITNYPVTAGARKTMFRLHFEELQEVIDCAIRDPNINQVISNFTPKKNISHSGLLVWLHNDINKIKEDIKPDLASISLDSTYKFPVYLIDNARASFILNTIDNIQNNFSFYYPYMGTATSLNVKENRVGDFLPLELVASDILPVVTKNNNGINEIFLYANQNFCKDTYKKLISYGLMFANGFTDTIKIGMPKYNPSQNSEEASEIEFSFSTRKEKIIPFCFNNTILNFIDRE